MLTHKLWEKEGIRIDRSGTPLNEVPNPVVSIFSTGVLEAAIRGIPAWVYHPAPPAWLVEFWDRYGMNQWGQEPTPAPVQPKKEPAQRIAELMIETLGGIMRILCVIPVRGGSKGIPRKNLRPIAGKPLVAWTIEQALAAKEEVAGEHELRVVVSTDDAELADIAREYGAEVPFIRPAHLAEDTTATEPVIEHAIEFYTENGWEPEAVMLLQATSPVRLPGTLARAVRQFAENGKDSMVGVIPIGPFIWTWHADGEPTAAFEIMARPRRQELTKETFRYRENGSMYITKTHVYTDHHNRLAGYPGGTIDLFMLDEVEGVDIDAPIDFSVAEHQLTQILAEGK